MISRLLLRLECTKFPRQNKIENLSTLRKTRKTEKTFIKDDLESNPKVLVIGDALSESSRVTKKRKKLPMTAKQFVDRDENESLERVSKPFNQLNNKNSISNENNTSSNSSSRSSSGSYGEQIGLPLEDERRNFVAPVLFPKKTPNSLFAEASNKPKAKLTFSKKKITDENVDDHRDRPFTLPSGQFKPKQSLGQNFLSDQNYVLKICDAFKDSSPGGTNVVEIGPGPGALTRVLYPRYPAMTAIEIDERAVAFLGEKLPGKLIDENDRVFHDSSHLTKLSK